MSAPIEPQPKQDARVYVLGGNASTLAFTSSLVPENRQVTAWLVPLAWTPIGVVLGENWQRVGIAADNVASWTDSTFDPSDERSFVSSLRDLELLARVGWTASVPETLTEDVVVNADDVPEDILDAFSTRRNRSCRARSAVARARASSSCGTSAACARGITTRPSSESAGRGAKRRTKNGCGRRSRTPHTWPARLLDDVGVDAVLAIDGLDDALAHRLINEAIAADTAHAHLAVRTSSGYTLLRERSRPSGDAPSAEES